MRIVRLVRMVRIVKLYKMTAGDESVDVEEDTGAEPSKVGKKTDWFVCVLCTVPYAQGCFF